MKAGIVLFLCMVVLGAIFTFNESYKILKDEKKRQKIIDIKSESAEIKRVMWWQIMPF